MLCDKNDRRVVPSFIKILKNKVEDIYIRELVAKALGRIGDKRAVRPLKKVLKEKSGITQIERESISEALKKITSKHFSYK